MQERGAERLGVEPHPGADLGHAHGMDDEVLAAGPALVRVALAGEREGALHQLPVHRLDRFARVLLHHGKEVREQLPLMLRELLRRR